MLDESVFIIIIFVIIIILQFGISDRGISLLSFSSLNNRCLSNKIYNKMRNVENTWLCETLEEGDFFFFISDNAYTGDKLRHGGVYNMLLGFLRADFEKKIIQIAFYIARKRSCKKFYSSFCSFSFHFSNKIINCYFY